jgi:hypothetical protein
MVKVKIQYPVDNTFLSSLLFEGLLFTIKNTQCSFSLDEVEFKDNKFLSLAYSMLDDGKIGNIKLDMAKSKNENINSRIFELFGLGNVRSGKNYSDLLILLKQNSGSLISRDEVILNVKIGKDGLLMDINSKDEGVQAALFKAERYIGITSTDTNLTTQHLTSYFSKEAASILLLGVYSSFTASATLTGTREGLPVSFFLTFSPEEIIALLSSGNKQSIDTYLEIKNAAMEAVRSIVLRNPLNELIVTEMSLNLELQRMLSRENIDKISFTLFKIVLEGKIYKIYEQIPLTVLSKTPFTTVANRFFKKPEELIDYLSYLLSSPKGRIIVDLSNHKHPAYSNLLKAVNAIYRFVVLGDTYGWFEFTRELYNVHDRVEDEEVKGEYLEILRKLGSYS